MKLQLALHGNFRQYYVIILSIITACVPHRFVAKWISRHLSTKEDEVSCSQDGFQYHRTRIQYHARARMAT
jgi:hypothetical protein